MKDVTRYPERFAMLYIFNMPHFHTITKAYRRCFNFVATKGAGIDHWWNHKGVGAVLCLAGFLLSWYWFRHVPSPGKAIGAAAVVAGLMSVRILAAPEKILWVALLFFIADVEFRAINKDRNDAAIAQKEALEEQRARLNTLLQQTSSNFVAIKGDITNLIKDSRSLLGTTKDISALSRSNLINITGGDSFAYVYPDRVLSNDAYSAADPFLHYLLKIHNRGRQALQSVVVTGYGVVGGRLGFDSLNTLITEDRFKVPVGVLAPDEGRTLMRDLLDLPNGTAVAYQIFINSQTPGVQEILNFRKSKSGNGMAYKIVVFRVVKGNQRKTDVKVNGTWLRCLVNTGWLEPEVTDPGILDPASRFHEEGCTLP